MPTQNAVFVRRDADRKFELKLYENRDFKRGGNSWTITHNTRRWPAIPNDEVAAFKLSGDPGVRVEFFNAPTPNKRKTWAEVELTSAVSSIEVPNMRRSKSTYRHNKKGDDDNIDGKVSLIQIYR